MPGLSSKSAVASKYATPIAAVVLTLGCGSARPAADLAKAPEFEPQGQAKCRVQKSQDKPLVVEWTSADRAELEARTQAGLVAIRYQGCELTILPDCQVKGSYLFQAVTPKTDTLTIRDEEELFANLPVGAAGLEGTLKRAGQLNVSMNTVGRFIALPSGAVYRSELQGACDGATHVVSAYSVGAFEMFSGADASVSAGVSVLGVGAGTANNAHRSTLTADGDPVACRTPQASRLAPPPNCGAIIRLETAQILSDDQARSTHSAKSRIGTWLGAGQMCNGVGVITQGVRQVLVITETEMTGTISTKECSVTNAHVPLDGDQAVVGAGQISCSPSPCTLAYRLAANDGSSADFSKTCPDDFPLVMPVTVGGGGNRLTLYTGDANGGCIQTFVRQGTPPSASAAPVPTLVPNEGPEPSRSTPGTRHAPVPPQSRTASYVLGGVGAAGLGVSLVTGGMALGKKSTVDAECEAASRTCTPEGLDAAESGRTLSTVSTVSFGVGVIALGAALYLLLDSDESPNVGLLGGPRTRAPRATFNGVRW